MSKPSRVDRRTLFDAFRRSKPPSFSLSRFYDERDSDATPELPRFAVRVGLPVVATVPAYAEPVGPNKKSST